MPPMPSFVNLSVARIRDTTRKDFKTFDPYLATLVDLKTVVCERVWSPIHYSGPYRRKEFFASSQLIALDFDSGKTTLEDMKSMILQWDTLALIGTTKSHQKEKKSDSGQVQPPCDRFRAVFIMGSPITDMEQYEFNLKQWVTKLTADKGVKDAARYFYPCTGIYFTHRGTPMEWEDFPKDFVREADRIKARPAAQTTSVDLESEVEIPYWVIKAVTDGAMVGERHQKVYAVGAALSNAGFEYEAIVDYVLSGPLSEIGEADVRRQIDCGRKKVLG